MPDLLERACGVISNAHDWLMENSSFDQDNPSNREWRGAARAWLTEYQSWLREYLRNSCIEEDNNMAKFPINIQVDAELKEMLHVLAPPAVEAVQELARLGQRVLGHWEDYRARRDISVNEINASAMTADMTDTSDVDTDALIEAQARGMSSPPNSWWDSMMHDASRRVSDAQDQLSREEERYARLQSARVICRNKRPE